MFDFNFILTSIRNNPVETNSLLNASAGTFENIDTLYANNLVNALKDLKLNGWWIVGLDHNAKHNLKNFNEHYKKMDKLLIVLGSEGKGIRKLVKKNCDILVKIDTKDQNLSLNVSNSAAIAFYQIYNNI